MEAMGGQTTASGLELLALGFVTTLPDPALADRLRVAQQHPDVEAAGGRSPRNPPATVPACL